MRLFISEFVCGGGWPEPALSPSLAAEGRAMLLALLEDAARVPGWNVSTTWDRRLGAFPMPGLDCRLVSSPQEESAAFRQLTRTADWTCVIAPELDDLLRRRCRNVIECGGRLLNADDLSILQCSDKLETFHRLRRSGIPTIATELLSEFEDADVQWPIVVKPRFGAGSQETRLVRDAAELSRMRRHFDADSPGGEGIVQPFVPGRALSVAVIVRPAQKVHVWPVAEQRLSTDGHFQYQGGCVPARNVPVEAVQNLAVAAATVFAGLRGYVGVDLLLPNASPPQALVVELNPRLTTSYIGYRQLTRTNLAPHVLQPPSGGMHRQLPEWGNRMVAYDASGSLANDSPESV